MVRIIYVTGIISSVHIVIVDGFYNIERLPYGTILQNTVLQVVLKERVFMLLIIM